MDLAHFGLKDRPFKPRPDLGSYYPATGHEDALGRLRSALADGEGIAVLTGEMGTGKTLLAQCLLDRLGEDTVTALITNSHFGRRADLLQAILYDLSLPYEGKCEQELRLALTDFLLARHVAGQMTLIVIDEAHLLPASVLEELRLLGNLESPRGKAVQVILIGLPSLNETLNRPELAPLRQRIVTRVSLEPLGLHEAADYLLHQLRVAGARPDALIADEAVELIARAAGGIPRVINQVAFEAFAQTAKAGAGRVDVEGALEALAVFGLETDDAESEPADESPRLLAAVAAS